MGPYCRLAPAEGAFYLLLQVGTELSGMQLAQRLITEYGVAVIPGATFGLDAGCHLRIAYGALQKENAAQGIRRLVVGLKRIVGGEFHRAVP